MKLIALVVTLLGTSACTSMGADRDRMADQPAPVTMSSANMPMAALPYMKMAGASDLYEKESSRLALTKTQNAAIRDYANMMISDHSKTTETLMSAARSAGLTPPPAMLMPMQRDQVAALQKLDGAAFDRAYVDQQTESHEKALALHQNYAAGGDNASLRTAATAAVPIVSGHLDRVRQLNGSM